MSEPCMPDSDGDKIIRIDSIRNHIEYASRYARGKECLTLISGWLVCPGLEGLMLHDAASGKTASMNVHYWPRADIDAKHGACLASSQRGYGYMAVAQGFETGPEINLVAVARGRRLAINSPALQVHGHIEKFIDSLDEAQLPAPEISAIYELVCQPLLRARQQKGRQLQSLEHERGRCGEPVPQPEISLVIPLAGNLDNLAVQLLALSEDTIFRERAEIIYAIDDTGLHEKARQMLTDRARFHDLPLKWIFTRGGAGIAALNIGAGEARGKIVAFISPATCPPEPGWLGRIAAPLLQDESLAAVGGSTCEVDGSRRRGLHEFHPEQVLPALHKVQIPDFGDANIQIAGEDAYLNEDFFAVRLDDFNQAGGFDPGFADLSLALAKMCVRLRENSKKIAYLPEPALAMTATTPAAPPDRGSSLLDSLYLRTSE